LAWRDWSLGLRVGFSANRHGAHLRLSRVRRTRDHRSGNCCNRASPPVSTWSPADQELGRFLTISCRFRPPAAASVPNGRAQAELRSQISVGSVAEPEDRKAEAVSATAEALWEIGGSRGGREGRTKKQEMIAADDAGVDPQWNPQSSTSFLWLRPLCRLRPFRNN
jgi:hypothetical protein